MVTEDQWQASAASSPLVLLVDLDNWPTFFRDLPCALPAPVHVAAYFRPSNAIDENALQRLPCVQEMGQRLLLSKSMTVKDSADCKLIMTATALSRDHKDLTFVVLSADGCFQQLQYSLNRSRCRSLLVRSRHMPDVVTVLTAMGFEMLPIASPYISRSPTPDRRQGKKRRFQSRSPSPASFRPRRAPASPAPVSLAEHVTAAFASESHSGTSWPVPSPRQSSKASRSPSPQRNGSDKKDTEFGRQLSSYLRKYGPSVTLKQVEQHSSLLTHMPAGVSLEAWLRQHSHLYSFDGTCVMMIQGGAKGQIKGFAVTKLR